MLHRLSDDPRSPLLALILATAVPILFFGGWTAYRSAAEARDTAHEGSVEIVARVGERVEAEIAAQLATADALAASTAFDGPDLAAFYTEAQRLKRSRPLWHTIELTDPAGSQVMNLLRPAGDQLGPTADRASFERVVRTLKPAVGGIGPVGAISGMQLVALRVPVVRAGKLRYVLSVALAPAGLSAILRAAGAPAGWIGTIVDGQGVIVARTLAEGSEQGRSAGPIARAAVAGGPTGGSYIGPTLEGINTETVFRTLPRLGGWSVHFSVPKETLDGPVRRSLYVLALGGFASLALGTGLAGLTARDVARRRRAEAARSAMVLERSEESRTLAVEAAELGTWRWERRRNLVRGSARCRHLLGLPTGATGDGSGVAWPARHVVAVLAPEDRTGLIKLIRRCLHEDTPIDTEFRVPSPPTSGDLRWLRVTGRALRQGPGRPSGVHGVIADITTHKRAEAERLEFLRRLAQAQEDEQRRIARELHDQVGQLVTGLSLGLKGLECALGDECQRQQVGCLRELAVEIGREIHRTAADLRPSALDDLGLYKALQAHCSACSETHGVAIDFQGVGFGDRRRLSVEIKTVLYRIAQEAITNVLKHAGARNVSVVLERKAFSTRLIVEDDGRGFDPDALSGTDAPDGRRHLGFLGIRERLSLVGGTLTVESAPGAGTSLFVRVPTVLEGDT